MRKPVYAICQQQRSRSDCSSAQSDQHHFVLCLDCIIPILSKIKMSRLLLVSGWAGRFESYLVANPRRQVFSWHGSYHKNDKHYIVWSECSLVCIYTPYMIWAAAWQNQRKGMCAQRRLRSAWASAQSDQSLCWAFNGKLRTQGIFMWTAKTDQTGWMPRLISVFCWVHISFWHAVAHLSSGLSCPYDYSVHTSSVHTTVPSYNCSVLTKWTTIKI